MINDYDYIFRRRHSQIQENRLIWERCAAAYAGGEKYIHNALIRHMSEIEPEFAERCRRAYYFNYPRKLARLITQYSLSSEPERVGAPEPLVEDFSKSGLRTNEVMRQFSTMLNIFGSAWLLVEMPALNPENSEIILSEHRPYAMALPPHAVPDWAFDGDGRLSWAIVEEQHVNKDDPFAAPTGKIRRRLWTRNEWQLFEQNESSGKVELIAQGIHDLGAVPLVMGQEADGFGITSSHWFEDVVRISDAILNNESEAQMNIVKQMFGLLVIPESFARSSRTVNSKNSSTDSTAQKFSHQLARSAAVWESNEERGISRYISPSGSDTAQIREENFYLKRELYDVVGMALQRESAVAQTAESKAWDYQNVRQFLTCRVDLIEQCEAQAWKLMQLWDESIPNVDVIYSRDFAVMSLRDSIDTLLCINQLASGSAFRREIGNTALGMLEKIRKLPGAVRNEIISEIASQSEDIKPNAENENVKIG